MHPRDDVTRGERLIKKVYETLRASQLWEESVLLVVFDEHGGFFDHVPPPATTPPGDKPGDDDLNTHHFNFDRLGPRVPAIVVSPWVPANLVDHAQYEHASVPATVEALFGLSHLTQRDAHANDFLHLLSLHAPRKDAPLQLPSAAVSGLDCSDEEEAQQGIVPPDKLEQVDLSRGSTMGFLQIAVRRHLSLVPLAERSGVMQRVGAIHTIADARDYMREVKGIVQARRVAGRTVPPSP
jgi:phospholipase C